MRAPASLPRSAAMSASGSRRLSGSGKTKERWASHAMPVFSPTSCCNWPAGGRTTASIFRRITALGRPGFSAGNWQRLAHTSEGSRLYDPEEHHSHRFIYGGHDPGACAVYTAAQLVWSLGFPDRAAAAAPEGVALADRIAHPFTREVALEYAAHVHLHRREPENALAYIGAVENLRAEQRLSYIIEPAFLRGAAQLEQGATTDTVAMLRAAFASGNL